MRLGDFELFLLTESYYTMDAGVLFGPIPKSLWSRHVEVGNDNLFEISVRLLLIKAYGKIIIIDGGLGNKLPQSIKERANIRFIHTLPQLLEQRGLKSEDVNIVAPTHLHFDHAGTLTVQNPDGLVVPTFPNATYVIQREEWANAKYPDSYGRVSYFPENFECLEKSDKLKLVDGDWEIVPGINAVVVGGHVPTMEIVEITSKGKSALYLSDLIPTRHHVRLKWHPAYDVDPMTILKMKQRYLRFAERRGSILLFKHDPEIEMAYYRGKDIVEVIRKEE